MTFSSVCEFIWKCGSLTINLCGILGEEQTSGLFSTLCVIATMVVVHKVSRTAFNSSCSFIGM